MLYHPMKVDGRGVKTHNKGREAKVELVYLLGTILPVHLTVLLLDTIDAFMKSGTLATKSPLKVLPLNTAALGTVSNTGLSGNIQATAPVAARPSAI